MSESSASENAPAPATPDISALNKRLEGAQSELESLQRRVKRSSIISTAIGVILLLLLAGYFTYGYIQILEFVNKPEQLVSLVGQTVEGYLPQARKDLETTIVESAPEWAERASEELIASASTIREQLEGLIFDQTEALVDDLSGFTEKEFKKFLEEKRPTLESTIGELSSPHEPPERTMTELTEALEDELQVSMKEQADSLLHTVYALNEKLKKLADGRDLTREENYLRRAMMILRRVQLEQADPSFVGKKWTIASKGDATLVEETPDKPDEKPDSEAAKDAEPKEEMSPPDAKEEAKPKDETPAPDAKEEAKPKADPAPKAKEDAESKSKPPASKADEKPDSAPEATEAEKAKADEPKPE